MVLTKSTNPEHLKPRIVYVGIFDYQKLVRTIATWFADQGYEFHEDMFKHKVPSPSGSEQEFGFRGWRKTTEYVQYWIILKCHIWELKEVDILVDGAKKKMAKGKLQLILSMEVFFDYNEKFKTPSAVKIQNFLHKQVWDKQISGGWEDECYYRMYKLHKVIKETLNMSCATNASEIRY
jgi:hypothetical protein